MVLGVALTIIGEAIFGTGVITLPRAIKDFLGSVSKKTKESTVKLDKYTLVDPLCQKAKDEIKEFEKLYGEIKFLSDEEIEKKNQQLRFMEAMTDFYESCNGDPKEMRRRTSEFKQSLKEIEDLNGAKEINLHKEVDNSIQDKNKKSKKHKVLKSIISLWM